MVSGELTKKQETLLAAQERARRRMTNAKPNFNHLPKSIPLAKQTDNKNRDASILDNNFSTSPQQKSEKERHESFLANQAKAWKNKTIAGLATNHVALTPAVQNFEQNTKNQTVQNSQTSTSQQTDKQTAAMSLMMASAQQQASIASINQQKNGSNNLQEQTQKQAKKAVMDSVGFVMEGIADALDLGTGSITLVVDFTEHVFFIVWTHLRLFVYYWDYQGTSRLIPLRQFITPLEATVGPINLSNIIPPTLIHVALIMFDIFILILILIFLGFGLLIILAYVKFISDPLGAILSIGNLSNRFGILDNLLNFVL